MNNTNLKKTNLEHANLTGPSLERANLMGANLKHSQISDGTLWPPDLVSPELAGAVWED